MVNKLDMLYSNNSMPRKAVASEMRMASILQELQSSAQYRDRRFDGTDEEFFRALQESCTVYVGNLAFATREEQLYEVFSKVGPIDRVHMGLNQITRRPCGFAFVVYYSHKVAESACSFISGTKLDNRYVRVDMDWGFQEGRQFGRGKSGGQVRDEMRQSFDPGRQDMLLNVYSRGMGDSGVQSHSQPGDKRSRLSHTLDEVEDRNPRKKQRMEECDADEPLPGAPKEESEMQDQ